MHAVSFYEYLCSQEFRAGLHSECLVGSLLSLFGVSLYLELPIVARCVFFITNCSSAYDNIFLFWH